MTFSGLMLVYLSKTATLE